MIQSSRVSCTTSARLLSCLVEHQDERKQNNSPNDETSQARILFLFFPSRHSGHPTSTIWVLALYYIAEVMVHEDVRDPQTITYKHTETLPHYNHSLYMASGSKTRTSLEGSGSPDRNPQLTVLQLVTALAGKKNPSSQKTQSKSAQSSPKPLLAVLTPKKRTREESNRWKTPNKAITRSVEKREAQLARTPDSTFTRQGTEEPDGEASAQNVGSVLRSARTTKKTIKITIKSPGHELRRETVQITKDSPLRRQKRGALEAKEEVVPDTPSRSLRSSSRSQKTGELLALPQVERSGTQHTREVSKPRASGSATKNESPSSSSDASVAVAGRTRRKWVAPDYTVDRSILIDRMREKRKVKEPKPQLNEPSVEKTKTKTSRKPTKTPLISLPVFLSVMSPKRENSVADEVDKPPTRKKETSAGRPIIHGAVIPTETTAWKRIPISRLLADTVESPSEQLSKEESPERKNKELKDSSTKNKTSGGPQEKEAGETVDVEKAEQPDQNLNEQNSQLVSLTPSGISRTGDRNEENNSAHSTQNSVPESKRRRKRFKRYERSNRRLVINPSSESESDSRDTSSLLDEEANVQLVEVVPNGSVDYNEFESLVMEELLRDERLLEARRPITLDDEESETELNKGDDSVIELLESHSGVVNQNSNSHSNDERFQSQSRIADLSTPHNAELGSPQNGNGHPSDDELEEIDVLIFDALLDEKRKDKRRKMNSKRRSGARKLYREQMRKKLALTNDVSSDEDIPSRAVLSTPNANKSKSLNLETRVQTGSPLVDDSFHKRTDTAGQGTDPRANPFVIPSGDSASPAPASAHQASFLSPNKSRQSQAQELQRREFYAAIARSDSSNHTIDSFVLRRNKDANPVDNILETLTQRLFERLTQRLSQVLLSQPQRASQGNSSQLNVVIPNSSYSISDRSHIAGNTELAIDSSQESQAFDTFVTPSPPRKSQVTQSNTSTGFAPYQFGKTPATNGRKRKRAIKLIPFPSQQATQAAKPKSLLEELRERYQQAGIDVTNLGVDSDSD